MEKLEAGNTAVLIKKAYEAVRLNENVPGCTDNSLPYTAKFSIPFLRFINRPLLFLATRNS